MDKTFSPELPQASSERRAHLRQESKDASCPGPVQSILARNQEGKQAMAARLEELGLSEKMIRTLLNM